MNRASIRLFPILRETRLPTLRVARLPKLQVGRLPKCRVPASIRLYRCTPTLGEYPREGVFQPNSSPLQETLHNQQLAQRRESTQVSQHTTPSSDLDNPFAYFNQRPAWGDVVEFLIFYTIFILLSYGVLIFTTLRYDNVRLVPWDPDTIEEKLASLANAVKYTKLVLVRNLHAFAQQGIEIEEWKAYSNWDPDTPDGRDKRANMFSAGPLRGTRGLESQVLIREKAIGRLWCFVRFGGGLCDDTRCVHRGAISTVFDETLGREAMHRADNRAAVTAQLEIDFNMSVVADQWYVILVDNRSDGDTADKKQISGLMFEAPFFENAFPRVAGHQTSTEPFSTDRVYTRAKGTFVVPKGLDLPPIPKGF